MSTNRSVDRFAVTHKVDRFAVTHKNDRSCLCAFTFADGRRCRTPRLTGHPLLCCFHAKREAQSLAAPHAGRYVSHSLSGSYEGGCDPGFALARVVAGKDAGQVKPRT